MADKQFVHTWEYQGEKIGLGTDGRFYTLIADEDDLTYKTLEEAQRRIGRCLDDRKKTAKEKLNIPAYTVTHPRFGNGPVRIAEIVVTGVHAGNKNLLTNPKTEGHVYLRLPKVKELLEERDRLTARQGRVEKELDGYQLESRSWQNRNKSHEELIANLKEQAKKLESEE